MLQDGERAVPGVSGQIPRPFGQAHEPLLSRRRRFRIAQEIAQKQKSLVRCWGSERGGAPVPLPAAHTQPRPLLHRPQTQPKSTRTPPINGNPINSYSIIYDL